MRLVRLVLTALSVLAVVSVLAGTAAASPGDIDRSFGTAGRAALALGPDRGEDVAASPDGSLFVANSRYVAHVLRNGRLDPSFGDGGLAPIEAPAQTRFRLGDLAVDGSGRPLVFGGLVDVETPSGSGSLYPPEPPTSAMARRFQSTGAPDPSFAEGGVLVADFGLTGNFETAVPGVFNQKPTATIAQARLDRRERIVVAVARTGGGRGVGDLVERVARLGRNGSIDSSFGADGIATLAGVAKTGGMALDRRGAVILAGSPPFAAELVLNRLRPDGRPDTGFGPRGMRTYARGGFLLSMAANRFGGIALLGRDEDGQEAILRLHPDGTAVPGFADAGLRLLGAKRGERTRILLDRRGRVLTLGLLRDARSGAGTQAIERLLPNGGLDRGFGRRGLVSTGFAPASYEGAQELMFSGPRLITAGVGALDPAGDALSATLLARYTLR